MNVSPHPFISSGRLSPSSTPDASIPDAKSTLAVNFEESVYDSHSKFSRMRLIKDIQASRLKEPTKGGRVNYDPLLTCEEVGSSDRSVPYVREKLLEVLETADAVNRELQPNAVQYNPGPNSLHNMSSQEEGPLARQSNCFETRHHQDPFLMGEFSSHIPPTYPPSLPFKAGDPIGRIRRAALSTLAQTGIVYSGRENSMPGTRKHPLEAQGSGSK